MDARGRFELSREVMGKVQAAQHPLQPQIEELRKCCMGRGTMAHKIWLVIWFASSFALGLPGFLHGQASQHDGLAGSNSRCASPNAVVVTLSVVQVGQHGHTPI